MEGINRMTDNQYSRRRFLGGTAAGTGLLLGGGGILAACGNDDGEAPAATTAAPAATTAAAAAPAATTTTAAPMKSVNFQLSWLDSVQFGGSYIADERGYYNRFGLDVSLTPGGPGAPVDPPGDRRPSRHGHLGRQPSPALRWPKGRRSRSWGWPCSKTRS